MLNYLFVFDCAHLVIFNLIVQASDFVNLNLRLSVSSKLNEYGVLILTIDWVLTV